MSDQLRETPFHFFKCNCPCHKQILGQTYEKLRIRSDLGTSEENLTLNLRKTFDQCSIRIFGSAVLDPQITRYTHRFSPQLCSANYLLQYPHIRRSAHPHFTPGLSTRLIIEWLCAPRRVQILPISCVHDRVYINGT